MLSEVSFTSVSPTLICSKYSCYFINEDKNVFSFGKNEKGCLSHEGIDKIINFPKQIPNLMNIKMLDCGICHTVCIDYCGTMFTFGDNSKGQLGYGKDNDELPITFTPQQIINIPPIDFISCGNYFTICITTDGTAYSFGSNISGQLGQGNTQSYLSPQLIPNLNDIKFIQCGGSFTICKTYSNEYYSWGGNYYGQLGQGNNETSYKPIKCLNWPEDIIDIKCGYHHTLLLTLNGYVYSFGMNKFLSIRGLLGLNDKNIKNINTPTLIKDIPLIKRIECGDYHSMCIDINDNLWVFGYNYHGQLGLGDKESRYKPTLNELLHDIIDISSGGIHTFVKTINNEIYAFGNNEFSQLGIKTSENSQLTPIQVFKDKEDIWVTNTRRSKQKSARK